MTNILEEAMELTSGDRQRDYGHPRDNLSNIALMWSGYLKMNFDCSVLDLGPEDVAMMMTLLKIVRQSNASKRDNLVDAAGYLRLIEMIEE